MIKKYIKKPVEVEAIQLTKDNIIEVFSFIENEDLRQTKSTDELNDFVTGIRARHCIDIITLEGLMKANFGDYIIKGIKGEFYSCKPDIFIATYDEVK